MWNNSHAFLGVWKHASSLTSSDTLDSKMIGSFTINKNTYGLPEGLPENDISNAFLLCYGGGESGSWGLQILHEMTSVTNPRIWYRTYTSNTYNNWVKIFQKT